MINRTILTVFVGLTLCGLSPEAEFGDLISTRPPLRLAVAPRFENVPSGYLAGGAVVVFHPPRCPSLARPPFVTREYDDIPVDVERPRSPDEVTRGRPVSLRPRSPLQFVVAMYGDHRWTHFGPLEIRRKGNRLTLLVTMAHEPGPHIENWMPSSWSTTAHLEGLEPGEYDVYVYRHLKGRLSVKAE